jgi:hypothetical protein
MTKPDLFSGPVGDLMSQFQQQMGVADQHFQHEHEHAHNPPLARQHAAQKEAALRVAGEAVSRLNRLANDRQDRTLQALSCQCFGEISLLTGDWSQAEASFRQGLQIFTSVADAKGVATAQHGLAALRLSIAQQSGDASHLAVAFDELNKALTTARAANMIPMVADNQKLLGNLFAIRGDFAKAREFWHAARLIYVQKRNAAGVAYIDACLADSGGLS